MSTEDLDQILASRPGSRAAWCRLDYEWYLQAYPVVLGSLAEETYEAVRQYYIDHGRTLGHSPNMYFDERWYLQQYPDVAAEVANGEVARATSITAPSAT